jgi:uncharacterized membrane protein YgcG
MYLLAMLGGMLAGRASARRYWRRTEPSSATTHSPLSLLEGLWLPILATVASLSWEGGYLWAYGLVYAVGAGIGALAMRFRSERTEWQSKLLVSLALLGLLWGIRHGGQHVDPFSVAVLLEWHVVLATTLLGGWLLVEWMANQARAWWTSPERIAQIADPPPTMPICDQSTGGDGSSFDGFGGSSSGFSGGGSSGGHAEAGGSSSSFSGGGGSFGGGGASGTW